MIVLAMISCIAIASGEPMITASTFPYEFLYKQILWYVVSFVFMFFISTLNDELYTIVWWLYYIFMFLLLGLAIHQLAIQFHFITTKQSFIPFAKNINGATCWYVIKGIGSFQPSEFMKIILLLLLSKVIKEHNATTIHTFKNDFKLLQRVAMITIPPCLLIFLQNDAGVTLIILISIIFILYAGNLKKEWFIILTFSIIIIIFLALYMYFYHPTVFSLFVKDYRLHRFYGWLQPEKNYHGHGFQLFNALLSYGSASFFGHGYQSKLMVYPEPQTDFIFAVILQSFGFIGGFITISCILLLDIKILKIALKTPQTKSRYFLIGLFGLLFFQQFWNIAMILGLLPITGITLPFISYGGSSLLSYMLAMGIVFSIENTNKEHQDKLSKYII